MSCAMARKRTRLISIGSIVAWLAAGVVVTVAVAWGCALWSPLSEARGLRYEPGGSWRFSVPDPWIQIPIPRSEQRGHGLEITHQFSFNREGAWVNQAVWSAGWPAPSLVGWANVDEPEFSGKPTPGWSKTEWNAAIKLDDRTIVGDGFRALPLKPMPFGFIVDTLFWGAIVAGATILVRAFRRRRRIARGRCPNCNHKLAGAARCPECGLELAPVRGALASTGR